MFDFHSGNTSTRGRYESIWYWLKVLILEPQGLSPNSGPDELCELGQVTSILCASVSLPIIASTFYNYWIVNIANMYKVLSILYYSKLFKS